MSEAAEAGKRAAGEAAVALVQQDMRLGLGTGSTVRYVLEALGRRVREEGLRVVGIATSQATEARAGELGIPIGSFAEIAALDLAIDGADEVERRTLALIKGGGGALLREKIVAQQSRRFVVVADASKIVAALGEHMALPVEVIRFGHEATGRQLASLGGAPVLRQRAGAPFVTDNGNFIYDCAGFAPIHDPRSLQARLVGIAGVAESGLFCDMAEQAIIGQSDGSVAVLRP